MPRPRFAAISLRELYWVQICAPKNQDLVDELRITLGPGEAEALALAVEVHADAVFINESAGRKVARRMGLKPLGILGILLRAKERGLVREMRSLLDLLERELGFFLSDSVRNKVLSRAGE